MNCRSAESLFSSYVEDEISQEERRNLESHLVMRNYEGFIRNTGRRGRGGLAGVRLS